MALIIYPRTADESSIPTTKGKKQAHAYETVLKCTRVFFGRLLPDVVICFAMRNQAEEAGFNGRTELVRDAIRGTSISPL